MCKCSYVSSYYEQLLANLTCLCYSFSPLNELKKYIQLSTSPYLYCSCYRNHAFLFWHNTSTFLDWKKQWVWDLLMQRNSEFYLLEKDLFPNIRNMKNSKAKLKIYSDFVTLKLIFSYIIIYTYIVWSFFIVYFM